MSKIAYPSLYCEADAASNRRQKLLLLVISSEFLSLFTASIMTINVIPTAKYIVCYGIILAVAATLLGFRSLFKFDQGWYQARALAESVKTATWKYAMGAKPFSRQLGAVAARDAFRRFLTDILATNQRIGAQFDGLTVAADQITSEMEAIRAVSLDKKIELYMVERINSQHRWYARKAKGNRDWAIVSILALVGLYISAFAVLLVRVAHPGWSYSHPEPLILLATALIGWVQVKKFNELATSYNLTAIEIGILKSRAPEIRTNDQLSDFVDDAEEAFSREHTQWLARRSHQ